MKLRKLGNLTVSAVSLGCMGMTHASGAPSDPKEMAKVLHAAADIELTPSEVTEIDAKLEALPMSQVFGGSRSVGHADKK